MSDLTDEEYLALDEMVDEDSRARRADPLAFFAEVIALLSNNTVEGFLTIWRTKATYYRWFADDGLYCFDAVVAHPPPDLIERLRTHAGITLNHVSPTEVRPYSHDEVVAWLRELTAQMRAIAEETAPRAG